jgi:hypothetical protein
MKKTFLVLLFFYFNMNNAVIDLDVIFNIQPIQPTDPRLNAANTFNALSELEERSKRPDFISHGDTGFSWGRVFNFYDKHIFFDKDISGKPIYKRISEHATDNPRFGKVILVLYYPKKKYKNQFVILGTYSNPIARKKLLRKMQTLFGYRKEQAVWHPEQNVIIAGTDVPGKAVTNDLEIGKKFEKWLKTKK